MMSSLEALCNMQQDALHVAASSSSDDDDDDDVGTFNTISVNSLKPYSNLTVWCFHCFVILWHVVQTILDTWCTVYCSL
jgi:hypothetical protein